jgi:hypothetical protein
MVREDVVSYPCGDRLVAGFSDLEVLQIVDAGRNKFVAAHSRVSHSIGAVVPFLTDSA